MSGAALESLSSVRAPADVASIHSVVKALYQPWLDASARHFQARVESAESVARSLVVGTKNEKDVRRSSFADGLRFDVGVMLKERLEAKGLRVRLEHRLSRLPTVTATAKPIATIVTTPSREARTSSTSTRILRGTNQAVTAQRLRDEMAKRDFDLLGDEVRPQESGSTVRGQKPAGSTSSDTRSVCRSQRTSTPSSRLWSTDPRPLERDWLRIRVVTDHGWLLLPGGLPSSRSPFVSRRDEMGRCATVKGDSSPACRFTAGTGRRRPDCIAAGDRLLHSQTSTRTEESARRSESSPSSSSSVVVPSPQPRSRVSRGEGCGAA